MSEYDPTKPYGRPYVFHLERPLRPRPLGSVGGTMISRSSSSSGAPEADGRGGYTTRSGGRDQYGAYRGGTGGGSVGRLHVGVGEEEDHQSTRRRRPWRLPSTRLSGGVSSSKEDKRDAYRTPLPTASSVVPRCNISRRCPCHRLLR